MTDRELVDAYMRFRPVMCRVSLAELPGRIADHIPTDAEAQLREADFEFLLDELPAIDQAAADSMATYRFLDRGYTGIANRNDLTFFEGKGRVARRLARRLLAGPRPKDAGEFFRRFVDAVRESGLFAHPIRLVVHDTGWSSVEFALPSLAYVERTVAAALRVAVDTQLLFGDMRVIEPVVPGSRLGDWFLQTAAGEIPF